MIIVLTGIYSGIGRYLATQFKNKEDVYLIGLDITTKEELPSEVAASTDEYHRVDLSKPDQTMAFLDLLVAEKPHIDVFIHNAGIKAFGKVTDLDIQMILDTIQVNTVTAILFGKVLFTAYDRLTYIIIGSNSGFQASKNTVVYSASKAAVNAFAEGLKKEIGPGQRVHAVCPSVISTEEYVKANSGDTGKYKKPLDVFKAIDRIVQNGEKRAVIPVMPPLVRIKLMVKGLIKLFSWLGRG